MKPRILAVVCVLASAAAVSPAASSPAPSPKPSPAPTAAAGPAPCTAPEYHQFDFWLGDWNVVGTDGKAAGENHVVAIVNGCALQENWASVKGAHGTSFNIYDAATKKWHQTWVDDSGGLLLLDGELRDGKMILMGHRPSAKDRRILILHRITWTPLPTDRVRQFWEASTNEGRTWQTVFDGTYVKRQ